MRCCHKKTEDERVVDEAGRSEHPWVPWDAPLNAKSMDLWKLTPVLFVTLLRDFMPVFEIGLVGVFTPREWANTTSQCCFVLVFQKIAVRYSLTGYGLMCFFVIQKAWTIHCHSRRVPERGWTWGRVNSRTANNKLESAVPGLPKPEVGQGHRAVKLVEEAWGPSSNARRRETGRLKGFWLASGR